MVAKADKCPEVVVPSNFQVGQKTIRREAGVLENNARNASCPLSTFYETVKKTPQTPIRSWCCSNAFQNLRDVVISLSKRFRSRLSSWRPRW